MRDENAAEVQSMGLEVAQDNYNKSLAKLFRSESERTFQPDELLSEDVKVNLRTAIESQSALLQLQKKEMGNSVDPKKALSRDNSELPSTFDLDKPIDDLRMAGDILDGKNHNPNVLVEVIGQMATGYRAQLDVAHAETLNSIPEIYWGKKHSFMDIHWGEVWNKDHGRIDSENEAHDRRISNLKSVTSVALTNAPLWAAGESQQEK